MKDILDLKTYKQYLINYYKYTCDEDRGEYRKKYINTHYDTKILDKVVKDTKKFILSIIKQMSMTISEKSDNVFYKEIVSSNVYKDIYNGSIGGFSPDRLICPDEYNCDCLVSLYMIEEFFGNNFKLDLVEDIHEEYDVDDEVGYFNLTTYLYICGPKDQFLDIVDANLIKNIKIIKKINK
ncbi:MAG: hypothetical protein E7165_03135 [Firmicutes bacterium]|nr:hypothetical protein [Bacillota bacterium]